MPRPLLSALVLGSAFAAGVVLFSRERPPRAAGERPVARRAVERDRERGARVGALAPAGVAAADPEVPAAARSPLPESLRAAEVAGDLRADSSGRFEPDAGALRLFDYFLLAVDAEPLDVIRGRIVLQLRARLPVSAQQDALAVLDRYLALRRQVAQRDSDGGDPREAFEKLRELRRGALGAELARALYGDEEDVTRFELDRRALLQDPGLGEDEREQRLEELESRLPPAIRSAHERARAPERLRSALEELRASGAPAQEIRALREQGLGAEAAKQGSALDAERDAWEARWSRYRAGRAALLDDAALAPGERAARIDSLRRAEFAGAELARVLTLEDAEDLADAQAGSRPGAER